MIETAEKRSYIMSRIRKTNTKPELAVRSFLFREGYRFRIHVKTLAGCPDIVLPKYRKIIFVNGCFWHAHNGCRHNKLPKNRQEYWIPKIMRTVERDLENKRELERQGWRIIILWECELEKQKCEKTLQDLGKLLQD